jgi:hypothetical protein
MSEPLTIGNTNRAGTLQITDTNWDSNGTLRVTVREMIGGHCWDLSQDKQDRAVRDFARRALMYPEKTRSSRIVRRWYAQGTDHWTVAVSRLPRG